MAVSIVAVVVASREAIFCSCLAELTTCVLPMLTEVTVAMPALTIFLLSSIIVEPMIFIAIYRLRVSTGYFVLFS